MPLSPSSIIRYLPIGWEGAGSISQEAISAEGAVAGGCFEVGAIVDGVVSGIWAWLISIGDQ